MKPGLRYKVSNIFGPGVGHNQIVRLELFSADKLQVLFELLSDILSRSSIFVKLKVKENSVVQTFVIVGGRRGEMCSLCFSDCFLD